MLCDLLASENFIYERDIETADQAAHAIKPVWWNKFGGHDINDLSSAQQAEFIGVIKANKPEFDRYAAALKAAQKLRDNVNAKKIILFADYSMDSIHIDDFQCKLKEAQKFSLSPGFTETTMEKLATPETVVKAKSFFALTHDPMWIEWRYGDLLTSIIQGALMFSEPGGEYVFAYIVVGCPRTSRFSIKMIRFLPSTLRLDGENLKVDWDLLSGNNTNDGYQLLMNFEVKLLCDFIIRINSPRVTEFRRCEDLTRINRKRLKLGRLPLYVYQIVDLSKDIKASLREAENEADGVRFHWRRGHFKARRTGLFWWNPHTAGRKVYGEVKKEYVA
jgi:hypothetical protein